LQTHAKKITNLNTIDLQGEIEGFHADRMMGWMDATLRGVGFHANDSILDSMLHPRRPTSTTFWNSIGPNLATFIPVSMLPLNICTHDSALISHSLT